MNQTNLCKNLYSLRKKRGLSQEEFAEQIHVSRQAISKWERGEAYPDIENLISIAKFYEITLDELVMLDPADFKTAVDTTEFSVDLTISDDNDNDCDNDNNTDNEQSENHDHTDENNESDSEIKVRGDFELNFDEVPYSIMVTFAYLLLGFLTPRGWQIWWTLFITIPVYSSLKECFRNKTFSDFAYPIFITFIYLLIGMKYGIWHPSWVIFITVPIYYCIAAAIDKMIHKKRTKKQKESQDLGTQV